MVHKCAGCLDPLVLFFLWSFPLPFQDTQDLVSVALPYVSGSTQCHLGRLVGLRFFQGVYPYTNCWIQVDFDVKG